MISDLKAWFSLYLPEWMVSVGFLVVGIIIFIAGLLIVVAYLTLAERKVLAASQMRWGANVIGPFGLLQPFADGLKLIHKEVILPEKADLPVFLLAPVITFGLSLAAWPVIPFSDGWVFADINLGLLYILAISSMGVYGIILGGWASNSMYALYGGLRAAAQMISYEVCMGIILLCVVLSSGSFNLTKIVLAQKNLWYVVPHFPMFVVFIIAALAETNRTPFDLPEAEGELAGGYNVEYSSVPFAVYFLAEYGSMILMSSVTTTMFLGGWLPLMDIALFNWIPGVVWFAAKTSFILFVFLWVRCTLPRYRFDQLMSIGWKVFLPLSLLWFVLTSGFLLATGWLPQ